MLIFIILYFTWSYIQAGFLLADLRSFNKEIGYKVNTKIKQREDLAFSWFIGLIPISFIVIFFMTGFYSSGWTNPFKSEE